MSLSELSLTLTFKITYCCHAHCGAPIVMPTQIYNSFLEKRGPTNPRFFCCYGHEQCFTGDTEAQKLQRQLDEEKRSNEWDRARAARLDRQLSASKGQITKIKNRIGNGVCPCCNRSFENLQRHMHTKHPDYKNGTE